MIENNQGCDETILPADGTQQGEPMAEDREDLPGEAMGLQGGDIQESLPADDIHTDEPTGVAEEDLADIGTLAEEFLALADEIPSIVRPEDLPEEVWNTAAQGVPLRDAYLRFWFSEWRRQQEAAATRTRTRAGSAGSLRDIPDEPRPEEAAFKRYFQTTID